MMKEAIIFDLYDTLIFFQNRINTYNQLMLDLRIPSSERQKLKTTFLKQEFQSMDQIIQYMDVSEQLESEFYSILLEKELESADLFDDTLTALEKWSQSHRLFIASNLASPYKKPFYDLKLDKYFEKVFFSCEMGSKKPEAIFFNNLLKSIGLDKEKVVMIGNSYHSDYLGAKNIGLDALLLDRDNRKQSKIFTIQSILKIPFLE